MCFALFIRYHGLTNHDLTGLLTLLLAMIIYHADFLKKTRTNNSAHLFGKIPILNHVKLLATLKDKVTLDPNDEMSCPTGRPPHIEHAARLRNILEVTKSIKVWVKEFTTHLDSSVASAIDKKVAGECGINMGVLQKALV